jgi:hypothetical protein
MTRNVLVYLGVAAGIVAFSALFVLLFGNSIEVHCLRDAGRAPNCRITKKLLGQIPLASRDLIGVSAVQMDETCDDGCSYRAILVTSAGESAPVNDVYTDRYIVIRQMNALEEFLSGTQPSLRYQEPVPWWVVGMILVMDLIGLAIVAGNFLRRARTGQS